MIIWLKSLHCHWIAFFCSLSLHLTSFVRSETKSWAGWGYSKGKLWPHTRASSVLHVSPTSYHFTPIIIVGLIVDSSMDEIKIHSEPQMSFFYSIYFSFLWSLSLALPTMQPDHQRFDLRLGVLLAASIDQQQVIEAWYAHFFLTLQPPIFFMFNFYSLAPTDADSNDVTWGHLSGFVQLPLEPQKALCNLLIHALVLPKPCNQTCIKVPL